MQSSLLLQFLIAGALAVAVSAVPTPNFSVQNVNGQVHIVDSLDVEIPFPYPEGTREKKVSAAVHQKRDAVEAQVVENGDDLPVVIQGPNGVPRIKRVGKKAE
ncbi:hypothetical protein EX30DRAFT_340782 [Ascodesmis nigricans]|uniref:Uncharacterized protein n=1 Tax=Ascodesmis nigricans TaxID=341454 RepID=A0A4V3SIV5_9PEZI|nr:hypothetical protein EX30DRAFT_340782 [Ascodesmis nigricans]